MSPQTFHKLSILFATVGMGTTIIYAIVTFIEYIKIKKQRKP